MVETPVDTADTKEQSVLVVGATGNQGGVTIDHLLAADSEFTVCGLTRTPDSEAARSLAERGVDIRRGNLNDKETLRPAVDGIDAVVIVTNIWSAGFDESILQGKNIADVAVEMGVDHVVFSGAGYHDRNLGIAALEPTGEVEQYIRSLNVPATFLRPVWFMHNLEPAYEDILDGTLALPVEEDVTLQMIDVDDVGRATAQILADPNEFTGKGFDLAGDERSLSEMARILSEVTVADVQPYTVPIEDAREEMGDAMAELFQWFNDEGYSVDIEHMERRLGFEFTSFREYLENNGWIDKKQPTRIPGLVKAMMQG
ncbi:NmrA/HSCARG family protein [Halomicroarcula sp. F13]|uniref:NmrA/HSCARG family protein n=1 Tax=Haloarcula rubra TaxID=2487747 RepID=A0AAW4PWE2_9EURY|nr:NmrA/HSCARG family protein [Halomicroarcula rubra]MBX0325646.1 NmrA/HSCARG family protein [Halomicroarcula rubra]